MTAHSLRLRLIVGGVLAILVALTVAGVGLVVLFERHVTRTIGQDLSVYLNQLVAGIDVDALGRLVVAREPTDPRLPSRCRVCTGKSPTATGNCCARARFGISLLSCRRTVRRRARSTSTS